MPSTDTKLAARVLATTLFALLPIVAAQAQGLRAHQATFHTTFKGLNAGDLQLTLTPDSQPDSWMYETRAFPSFLASFVISPKSIERSWFRVSPSGVEPRRYQLNDGSSDGDKATDFSYDTAANRVTGTADGKPLDMAIDAGTQDVTSIRAALMVDLGAGREPSEYAMIDGRQIKYYVYTRIGTARIPTALGEMDTVIFSSARKGSDGHGRVWQYWYAPSLDWLPVRIEQREDGNTRMTFVLRSLKWLPANAASH
ncbi:MAG: DUF3108 domain-containing protein [Pseudomonadota bacterium]